MNTLKDFVNFRLTHADKIVEAEGYPLKMDNCKKYKRMKQLEIYGNSVQDGTPTPDAPIEIQSVGEKSVNLLEDARDIYNGNGAEDSLVATRYTETIEDGRECVKFQNTPNIIYRKIKFKENTQYTFSFDCKCVKQGGYTSYPPYDIPFRVYYTNGYIKAITIANDGIWRRLTFTSDENSTIDYIGGISFDYRDFMYVDINTFQIQEGATAAPYEPYGKYKIPVVMRGKNLVKDTREIYKKAHLYEEIIEDNRECIRFSTNNSIKYSDIQFKENTQYTFSFDSKCVKRPNMPQYPKQDYALVIFYTDDTRSIILSCDYDRFDTWTHRVLTSTANKTISSIGIYNHQYVTYNYIDINTFQIEESSTATEYEPYQAVTTNIFLNEPLRKVGVYADYIDFKENKVVRNIGVGTSNAISTWREESNSYNCGIAWGLPNCNYRANTARCTHLPYGWTSATSSNGVYFRFIDAIYWFFDKTLFPTRADADGWITSRKADEIPLRFHYVFTTPTEEPLNIELPKLKAKTTIIEVDTNLLPSNAYGKYIKR